MKVFQIRQNFKSGPILAGAGYQLDFGRSRSRTPVQPYFLCNNATLLVCWTCQRVSLLFQLAEFASQSKVKL